MIWIFLTVMLLTATSILHIFHSGNIYSSSFSKLPDKKSDMVDSAKAYIAKLEAEILKLEEKVMGPISTSQLHLSNLSYGQKQPVSPQSVTLNDALGNIVHYLDKPVPHSPLQPDPAVEAKPLVPGIVDAATQQWLEHLHHKLRCLHGHHGGTRR